MNKGFFLLHRRLWDKQWFLDLDFEQQITLINIIRLANWESNTLGDGRVLQPGQLAVSQNVFAAKIGTTRQRFRTLLTICSNVGFLTHESTMGYTVISITNWDAYQGFDREYNQPINQLPTSDQPATNHDITINKKQQTKRKELIVDSGFEKLWAAYPNRDSRKQSERHFLASVKTERDLADITQALENYKAMLAMPENSFRRPKSGATWFNNWRDWVDWKSPTQATPFAEPATTLWREIQALKIDSKAKNRTLVYRPSEGVSVAVLSVSEGGLLLACDPLMNSDPYGKKKPMARQWKPGDSISHFEII